MFDKTTNQYSVKDEGNGLGTFMKIEQPLELKQSHIIAFGESSLAIISVTPEILNMKFLDGPKSEETMYFIMILHLYKEY